MKTFLLFLMCVILGDMAYNIQKFRKAHDFATLTEDLSHMTLVQGPTCLEVYIEDTFVGLACPTEEGYDFIPAK